MNLSRRAKVLAGALVLAGVLSYAAVVEIGISAGRVHHGVSVEGLSLSGMSFPEATAALEERGLALAAEQVVFRVPGVARYLYLSPSDVGWTPHPLATAAAAMRVGRNGSLVAAASDRARAWLQGIELRWSQRVDRGRFRAVLDRWEREVAELGLDLRRFRTRKKIHRAIQTWPRRTFRLPVRRP